MVGDLAAWQRAAAEPALVAALAGGVTPALLARLRRTHAADTVACAAELARARVKAAAKWPAEIAERLLADPAGVEMASSAHAAAHKARRFAGALGPGSCIADLCCGIGGDAMAFASAGLEVLAVDLEPVRAWMAGENARCPNRCADAISPGVCGGAWHIDPARRTAQGDRRLRLADLTPGPDALRALREESPEGAIKLAPGVSAAELGERGLLRPEDELEIVSERGRLTLAVAWLGGLASAARRATLLDADGRPHTIAGVPSRSDERAPVGRFVFAIDPSVERADLVPAIRDHTGLRQVHPGAGLLTGDAPSGDAMLTPFAVLCDLPWNRRRVRGALADLGAGIVEVKTRGGLVDPDREQRELRGPGNRTLTVLAVRLGDDARGIVCERVAEGI